MQHTPISIEVQQRPAKTMNSEAEDDDVVYDQFFDEELARYGVSDRFDYNDALDFKRYEEEYPGFAGQGLKQSKSRMRGHFINQKKMELRDSYHKADKEKTRDFYDQQRSLKRLRYYHKKHAPRGRQSLFFHDDEETAQMKEVIRLFNLEELDAPSLNMLRRRVQTDFIVQEDKITAEGIERTLAKTKRQEELEVQRFLQIYKDVIKDQLSGATLHELLECICDQEKKIVKYEKFNKLCDLYFYMPGKALKQKNDSENLHLIMSSMAHKKASILYPNVSTQYLTIFICFQIQEKKVLPEKVQKTQELVEKFWFKISQKFKKMGDMFRYFDKAHSNEVTFKEFRISCEELDLRYTNDEVKLLFEYIDEDGGGTIGYTEFLNLSDERRRGLDPLMNMTKNKVRDLTRERIMGQYQIKEESEIRSKSDLTSGKKKQDGQDIMKIFEQRNKLFDIERYKGKNSSPVEDAKRDLMNCSNIGQQDYKFRRMKMKFNTHKLAE